VGGCAIVAVVSLLLLFGNGVVVDALSSASVRIQVCQNKDCCQRWKGKAASLPETLQDFYDSSVSIETTSCLSQCGKGPNVCVSTAQTGDVYLTGLVDPTAAAVQLESILLEMGDDTLLQVPSKLLAAANCMNKVKEGT
jgi:(2Fe-2S) ferredoxin